MGKTVVWKGSGLFYSWEKMKGIFTYTENCTRDETTILR